MKITEIVLIPASQGRIERNLAETELIKRYARALSDELDNCSIRHRTGDQPRPWEFALSLGLGWSSSKKEVVANHSKIWISDAKASGIASLLAETLSHWGQTYVGLEHRSCKPIVRQETAPQVHLEPFQLNGVKADSYAQRLEELGRDLARSIADYMIRERSGGISRTTTAADLPQLGRRFY